MQKKAEPIEMSFGVWTQVGPGNHVLDRGPNLRWEGSILRGEGAAYCKVSGVSAVNWAKMTELIKILFGLWTQVGPRKHVLDGVHIGATWRIRLNRPCATAMWPFVKLL